MAAKETTESLDAKKSRLYNEALRDLREAHREEFIERVQEKFTAAGMEYRPRLTKEERARAKIMQIAREHGLEVTMNAPGVPQPAE